MVRQRVVRLLVVPTQVVSLQRTDERCCPSTQHNHRRDRVRHLTVQLSITATIASATVTAAISTRFAVGCCELDS